jgi:uncharacterized sulfatase
LNNPKSEWNKTAFTEVTRNVGKREVIGHSVRNEHFRYTEWDGGKKGKELYDEVKDPKEYRNLVNDPKYAATVTEMKKLLATIKVTRKN